MPVSCAKNLWADSSAGWQWAVHPAQVNLCYFYPALTDGRQAMAVGIEQGEVAARGV